MRLPSQAICMLVSMVGFHISPAMGADGVSVSEVADGIFVYQGVHEQMSPTNLGGIGNSGFIVGERAVAVIDPGGSPEFGRKMKIAVEDVTNLPVEYIVLTHFHPDHAAGAHAFPEASHVIAHQNFSRAMTQRAQFYVDRFSTTLNGSVRDVFRIPTQEIQPQRSVDIDLGGRVLTVEAVAVAHTDNDVIVHDLQTNTLWASDLVFSGRTPSLDGSLKGWLEVLSLLDARDYDLTIPGHGVPAAWPELLAPQRAYLLELESSVREMLAKGMSLSEVLVEHDASRNSDRGWALFAFQHGSNLAKVYAELEWE
ncbi:MAG: quinoprotein relay system zinc metallohydrolase 2 [Granulosicoccus sp.]